MPQSQNGLEVIHQPLLKMPALHGFTLVKIVLVGKDSEIREYGEFFQGGLVQHETEVVDLWIILAGYGNKHLGLL